MLKLCCYKGVIKMLQIEQIFEQEYDTENMEVSENTNMVIKCCCDC